MTTFVIMGQKNVTVHNEELREAVEEYRDKAGYDSINAAAEDIMSTGLREVRSPLLNRLRERALGLAEMLTVFALVFLAAGAINPSIPYAEGFRMAIVLLAFAVAIPGIAEFSRLVAGTNEIGDKVHEVIRS